MTSQELSQGNGVASSPKVSIVVPVYRVEDTLDACVQSLVDQELRDIEIILVDDGSPDGCPAMCDAWASRDDRIRVLHKPNGGVGNARNAGVAVAKAPTIGFVDSDDVAEPSMYRTLYELMTSTGSDVALCGVASHYGERVVATKPRPTEVVSGEEALRLALQGVIPGIWPYARLYSRDLIAGVPFPDLRVCEDAYITADVYARCRKVAVSTEPLYHYLHREGSLTRGNVDAKALDAVVAFEHMCDVAERTFPSLSAECEFRRLWVRFDVLDRFAWVPRPLTDEQRRIEDDLVAYVREHGAEVRANPFFGRSRKLAARLLGFSRAAYYALVRRRDRTVGGSES